MSSYGHDYVPIREGFSGSGMSNLLKDCPITNIIITNAHQIFGSNLANIRGETVWKKPKQICMDYIEIQRKIIDIHLQVALVVCCCYHVCKWYSILNFDFT